MDDLRRDPVNAIAIFLDDDPVPVSTHRPPAVATLDTSKLPDGPHVLRIEAIDALGNRGVRTIPFVVANGPGITVTGVRAGERVRGELRLDVNAFGSDEPFDPVRAESSGPIPVWTWVMMALIAVWAGWYGLEFFETPAAFALTPTFATNPVELAVQPAAPNVAPSFSGHGAAAGFDYATTGAQLYVQNCAACHGAAGAGTPGAFPPLAANPVVTAENPDEHVRVVLHGLRGKAIGGTSYASQMPSFAQLDDAAVAAIVDHERTSWGNHAPTVTPDAVKKLR
jgi:mono/diheme cytochrome c family protein